MTLEETKSEQHKLFYHYFTSTEINQKLSILPALKTVLHVLTSLTTIHNVVWEHHSPWRLLPDLICQPLVLQTKVAQIRSPSVIPTAHLLMYLALTLTYFCSTIFPFLACYHVRSKKTQCEYFWPSLYTRLGLTLWTLTAEVKKIDSLFIMVPVLVYINFQFAMVSIYQKWFKKESVWTSDRVMGGQGSLMSKNWPMCTNQKKRLWLKLLKKSWLILIEICQNTEWITYKYGAT